MKFCKDCKHYEAHALRSYQPECVRPIGKPQLSPVTGEAVYPRLENVSCEEERHWHLFYRSCGPDAKHFEAKPEERLEGTEL